MYFDYLAIAKPRFTSMLNTKNLEHTHDYNQIFYTINDIGSICIEGKNYPFRHNHIYFVPAGMNHMCSFSGYQEGQLFRMFRKRLGTTPHMYLNSLRIHRAKELLASKDIKITDIAYIVGFQSSEVFRATFRRLEGISPDEYRKSARRTLKPMNNIS